LFDPWIRKATVGYAPEPLRESASLDLSGQVFEPLPGINSRGLYIQPLGMRSGAQSTALGFIEAGAIEFSRLALSRAPTTDSSTTEQV